MSGNNVGLFGYGYSGSGKTYNLIGNYPRAAPDREVLGLIPLFITDCLNKSIKITVKIFELYGQGYPSGAGTCAQLSFSPTQIFVYHNFNRNNNPKTINQTETSNWNNEPYNIDITDAKDFCSLADTIDTQRKKNKRVTYTINNDKSSRGHLFYYFTFVEKDKPLGKLLVCDMGGRENPQEISEKTLIDTSNGKLCKKISDEIYEYIKETDKVKDQAVPEEKNVRRIFDYDGKPEGSNVIISKSFIAFLATPRSGKHNLNMAEINEPFRKEHIRTSVEHVIERCKEGFFINETINHLVAYINYLSFENSFVKNNTGKPAALQISSASRNICPIKLKDKDNSIGNYIYYPKVCSDTHNPLKIIYSTIVKGGEGKDERARYCELYNIQPSAVNVKDYYKNDSFGIITLLRLIKTPANSNYYSILSTVACVMLNKQNEGEVRRTLEFAQSISASGVEPRKYIPDRKRPSSQEGRPPRVSDYTSPLTKRPRADRRKGGSNNKTRKNKKGLL